MTKEATEIEVEVVEIDGVSPVPPQASVGDPPRQSTWQDWHQWQGKLRTLDSRWWPLWTILGIIAVVLLLTVGLLLAVVFLIVRMVTKIVRSILR
jgi:hypothetical protein